jgi:pilus assembly protein CpaC
MVALALFAGAVSAPAAQAQSQVTRANGSLHSGSFTVAQNQSQVLKLETPFADVLVGNAEIADVLPLTDRSLYVLGKKLGTTRLTVYEKNKRLIAVIDLVVTYDIDGLKSRLNDVMPGERIEIRPANDALVLSGTVSNASRAAQALAVAERYAPGKVTNLMSVNGSQQVMLAVRFAEVQRTAIKELGFNTQVNANDFIFSNVLRIPAAGVPGTPFGSAVKTLFSGTDLLRIGLDALERKGAVRTLAEPNLIALSGDTASFLAGGEFPVPVAQENNTITIEFKPFGVSLSFTPTVLGDGLINIVVAPEVSRIDPNNSITINNLRIPGISTRRAKTTVELRDGQSFAIAGLIQSDFQDAIRQFPGLGDVPVLGALMRSSDFNRNESELVIIVTPHLVRAAPAESMATPADRFTPPSDLDLFLWGRTEATAPGRSPAKSGASALGVPGAAGLDGPHGHIIK